MRKKANSAFEKWLIVPACTLCISVSVLVLPLSTFGYFRTAMVAEFGWSTAAMSGAFTVEMILIMLALPFSGRLADSFGAKHVAFVSSVLYALVIASLGIVGPSLPLFYVLFGLLAIAGAGCSPIVLTRFITMWFEGNRALALGLALTGTGIGIAVLPVITQSVIDTQNWRIAYFVLAALVATITLPITAFILKEPGQSEHQDHTTGTPHSPDLQHHPGFTAGEARAQRVFWQMALGFLFLGIVFGGVTPNLPLLFADRGIAAIQVAKLQFFMGIASIAGRIIGGFLMDRVHAPFIGASFALNGAVALMLFASVDSMTAFAITASILFGLSVGTEADLVSYLSSRFFGLRSYAEIYGWQVSAYIAGAATAPFLVAYLADVGVETTTLFKAGALGFACSGAIVALLGRYPNIKFMGGSAISSPQQN